MATKSYTDIEQSKKLAEILPPESADACWTNHLFGSILSSWRVESTPPQEYNSLLDRFVVKGYLVEPAWSLTALLSVIPNYKLSSEHNYHTCTAVTSFGKETVGWFDNPIDACVEMIIKLHELNLL